MDFDNRQQTWFHMTRLLQQTDQLSPTITLFFCFRFRSFFCGSFTIAQSPRLWHYTQRHDEFLHIQCLSVLRQVALPFGKQRFLRLQADVSKNMTLQRDKLLSRRWNTCKESLHVTPSLSRTTWHVLFIRIHNSLLHLRIENRLIGWNYVKWSGSAKRTSTNIRITKIRITPVPNTLQTEQVIAVYRLSCKEGSTLHQTESLVILQNIFLADAAGGRNIVEEWLLRHFLLLRHVMGVPALVPVNAVSVQPIATDLLHLRGSWFGWLRSRLEIYRLSHMFMANYIAPSLLFTNWFLQERVAEKGEINVQRIE